MDEKYLGFEGEVERLDGEIGELELLGNKKGIDYSGEVRDLQEQRRDVLMDIYENLSGWETVQVARHGARPQVGDFLERMVSDYRELRGDRLFGDDPTMATGFGRIGREKVMIIGTRKGRTSKEKHLYNFGYAHPEGYRKALVKMKLAEKFGVPVVTLIDTPAAYPGVGAEERGQASAIATNLMGMSRLRVPIVCAIIGEGGSGGALGIGVGDRVAMMEHAYYSVIPPEGCAAILWRDVGEAEKAADALKLRAKDLLGLGVIDAVVDEPLGGAQRNPDVAMQNLENYLVRTVRELKKIDVDDLVEARYQKWRGIGEFN